MITLSDYMELSKKYSDVLSKYNNLLQRDIFGAIRKHFPQDDKMKDEFLKAYNRFFEKNSEVIEVTPVTPKRATSRKLIQSPSK